MIDRVPGQAGPTALTRTFERKVAATRRAIWLELVWVRLWIPFAIVGLFLAASFAGVWPRIGTVAHIGLLAVFAAGLLGALGYALWIGLPTREAAVRRLARR